MLRPAVLALAVLPVLSGCTAAFGGYAIQDAAQAYQVALAAGAQDRAPYHITLAREYLDKAREEDGYSDYGAVEALCRKSKAASAKAQELAEEGGVPLTTPTDLPESLWEKDNAPKTPPPIDEDDP